MFPIEHFSKQLAERQSEGLLRELHALTPHGSQVMRAGRSLVNFASNDYLDLARHPALAKAASDAAKQWGTGSTGSRLLTGSLEIFAQTEAKLALWKGAPAALYFNTGYMANLSLVTALTDANTHLFLDRLNHASLYDGASMSKAKLHRFAHNNPEDLRQLLKAHPGKGWIFTEAVFSMDGDIAPLAAYAQLATEFGVGLVVDEAHSEGIFGSGGRGLVHQLGLQNQVDVVMGTLGKALGCAGACVWAHPTLIAWLVNTARPFIYSTAQSPAVLGAVQRVLSLLEEESFRSTRLLELSARMRTGLQAEGFNTLQSASQIIPIVLGDNTKALSASAYLADHGFWASPIRHPTVPTGTARLRINLNAAHTESEVDSLIDALVTWRKLL